MSKTVFQDLILAETADFIVINKPPFIATLEDRASEINILSMARRYEPSAQVCHRLDKDTSGVLVIARNPEFYRHMSLQFQERQVTKVYHAVVEGIHQFREHLINEPIRKLGNGTVCVDRRNGREAQTVITTLQAYKKHMLLECRPVTGRMHQIRIHLSFLGFPISGDIPYGGHPFFLSEVKHRYQLSKNEEEKPLIQRHALHAAALTFRAMDDSQIQIEAPYPKDFRVLISQLEKNS